MNWNRKENLPEGYHLYTNSKAFKSLTSLQAANDNSDSFSSRGAKCHLVNGEWETKKRTVMKLVVTPERAAKEALAASARASAKDGASFVTFDAINFHTPEELAAGRIRFKASRKRDAEAMRPFLQKIHIRQSIGDPNCPRADNEDFPLLAVLRRDGHDHYIRLLLRYRQLVSAAEAQPLQGLDYRSGQGVNVASVSKKLDDDAEILAAAEAGWKDKDGNPLECIPGGEIEYTAGIRKSKGAHAIPARQAVTVNADAYFADANGKTKDEEAYKASPVGRTATLAKKFSSSALAEHIDAKATLAELRGILGGLLDAFEDAALGGQTFAQIGAKNGIGPRGAISAGNVLVFRALATLDDAWHDIAVRDRKAEKTAERHVLIARKALVAANDNFEEIWKKSA